MMIKYGENVKIRFHYADWRCKLLVKALCDLFNDVANVQTKELGFDVPTLNAQGLTWMLHRLRIQVSRMPAQGEEVVVETWPSGIDRLFALRDFRISAKDGKTLVEASSAWMVIDMARRRPMRLPACVTEVVKRCEDVSPMVSFRLDVKRMPQDGYENSREFVATYDNIDFNKHVTQATYVRWLTNALPFEFLKTHVIREIEVVYEHEILPDTTIYAESHAEEAGGEIVIYHRLQNGQHDKTHCQARSVWEKIGDE